MAIFDTFYIGTQDNRVVFNDENTDPYMRVVRRYPTRREVREFDIPLPESLGIADFETLIGKTYMVIEGKMYPNEESSFHTGRETLRKLASLTVQQDDANSDSGYVPMVWSENIDKQLNIKIVYVDMQESTKQGIIQPFRLLCKVKYPVIFASTPKSGIVSIGSASANFGGAYIPSVIPMQIGGQESSGSVLPFTLPAVLGATVGAGTIELENTGDLPTWPTITINGPVNKPRLTNISTGQFIELNVNLTSTSDSAIISYDQDSINVTALNQNAYGLMTAGSSLFKVKPGVNAFTLTGSSVGTGAKATVTFQSAYSLS